MPKLGIDGPGQRAVREVERSVLVRPRRQCPFSGIVVISLAPAACSRTADARRLTCAAAGRIRRHDHRIASLFAARGPVLAAHRSEEHTSELQSLMRISYAVFCLKKKNNTQNH